MVEKATKKNSGFRMRSIVDVVMTYEAMDEGNKGVYQTAGAVKMPSMTNGMFDRVHSMNGIRRHNTGKIVLNGVSSTTNARITHSRVPGLSKIASILQFPGALSISKGDP